MKQIVFFLISVLPLIGFTQTSSISNENNPFDLPIDSVTGKITFVKIIQAKDKSKSEIYAKVKNWITENYKSPKDVINIDDKESGIILLKSVFLYVIYSGNYQITVNCYFSLKVNIKDLKYKITITDFEIQPINDYVDIKNPLEMSLIINKNSEDYKKQYEARKEMFDVVKEKINSIISSIEHYNSFDF